MSSGLQATSAATTSPIRALNSRRPAANIAGTVATPASAESERRGASPKPNTRAQTQATQ